MSNQSCQGSFRKKISKILSNGLPFLAGPLAIAYVYITKSFGLDAMCSRNTNEVMALPLVGISVLSFALLAYKTKNELAILMTFLCTAFFFREWHFVGTGNAMYVAIVIVVCWLIYRRKYIGKLIDGRKIKIWLMAAASCYFLAQLMARRVFAERHLNLLPMENEYHISMEETLEAAGHIVMIVASIIAWATFYFSERKQKI